MLEARHRSRLCHGRCAAVARARVDVRVAALACACSLSAAAQTVQREDDRIPGLPESWIASSLPRELADPGGIRSALGREGITFHVNYIGEVLGNPTGGVKQGTVYDGRLELPLEPDLEKTIGWRGLSFFANGYQIHGRSISANNLGVLMPVSFIEALPDTRLFELWLEQKLFDGKLSIRLGQLSADSDFIISQGAQAFLRLVGMAVNQRSFAAGRRRLPVQPGC